MAVKHASSPFIRKETSKRVQVFTAGNENKFSNTPLGGRGNIELIIQVETPSHDNLQNPKVRKAISYSKH